MEAVGFGFGFLFIFIALAIICLCIPVAMGVYVYKDAKRRGMNAVLWTAVAIFVPSFIGLIVYLILRNEYSANTCPKCGKNVLNEFLVCPECAYPLKQTCPKCLHPLAYDWNLCPNCANPVPEYMKVEKPVKPKKDKGLKVLFALVIAVPILILALFVALGFVFMANVAPDIVYAEEMSVEAEFEDNACVIIDIDGYTDNVRLANVEFFEGDRECFGVEVPAYDSAEQVKNPVIVNYSFSNVWKCDCDSVVVTLISNDYKTMAVSDKTTIYNDSGYLDDCLEFGVQDGKLVRTDV